MSERPIAHLKVTLDGVEPPVLRRLEVPLDLRLDRLHQTLQVAMLWTDSHLWGFAAGDASFGPPDDYPGGPIDAAKVTLRGALERAGTKTLVYTYDYGDNWEHVIEVERIGEAEPGRHYPRLTEAMGACPPEDVGGVHGYEEFLAAIADPNHPAHEELLESCGGRFDPTEVDVEVIDAGLDRLAKRWNRRPPARKAKPK